MKSKGKNASIFGLAVFLICSLLSGFAAAGDVDVYAEAAYNDTYFDVYIYADFNVSAVISYGVRLEYVPAELTVDSVAKNISSTTPPYTYTTNSTLWELGSGLNKDNPDPLDTGTAVVFKGGILDEAAPTDGVIDTVKVFLGAVRFTSTAGPPIPTAPTLTLTYAEDYSADPNSYKNFVRYDAGPPSSGIVIDSADSTGVDFTTVGIQIRQRGDANGNGAINTQDMAAIRYFMVNGGLLHPWMDCNADGNINTQDMACVRYIMTH